MDMTYKLFSVDRSTNKRACVSPAILKFDTPEDGEIVAQRYRDKYPQQKFAVHEVDGQGYIVD
jgi:hypothetical protein